AVRALLRGGDRVRGDRRALGVDAVPGAVPGRLRLRRRALAAPIAVARVARTAAALLCAVAASGCAAGMQRSSALGRVELGAAGRDGDLSDRLLDGRDVALPRRLRPFAERVKRAVAQDWRPDQLVRQRQVDAALLDGSRR